MKTLEERKQEFKDRVWGLDEPDHRKEAFFEYWSEHGDNGKKMRFEMSKHQPFNTTRRMGTWKRNEKKWAKPEAEKPKVDFLKDRYGL